MWNHPNTEKIKNEGYFSKIKNNEVRFGLKNWAQVQKSNKYAQEEEKFEGGEREDQQEGELYYPNEIQEHKHGGETKDLFENIL
jgi:hypothetical protein